MTVEVVVEDDELEELAGIVRSEYRRSKDALGESIDAFFNIGTALQKARDRFPETRAFGAWFAEQNFGFTTAWARTLRVAAEHEGAVRVAIESQLSIGHGRINFDKAVKQAAAALGGTRASRPAASETATPPVDPETGELITEWPCIVIDPPWRYGNTATRAAAEDHYPTMSLDELGALELPAAENAHLYLWTTTSFLREAFDLCELWGFTYKTTLTWCKPSIGMGNYFRVNTEHVLFGVRGSLPTNVNNVGTWFEAARGRHSAKPESFYDLVERASPGPWLEMFARRRRFNWHTWGNEA